MSIRSYFAVKQRDEPELEKVVPSSMAEAVKTEMKRATDAEGGSIERKRGAYEKITPESKAKIAKYAAENGRAAAIRHFEKTGLLQSEGKHGQRVEESLPCQSQKKRSGACRSTACKGEVAKRSTDK